MARILIVEDQKIMQKYFEYIIMQEPEFRHVQTVSDAREAVKICDYSAIDLVIMDVDFPTVRLDRIPIAVLACTRYCRCCDSK